MLSHFRWAVIVLLSAVALPWFSSKLFYFEGQSLSHNILNFLLYLEPTDFLKTTNYSDPELLSFLKTKRGTFEPFYVCKYLPVMPKYLCDAYHSEMEAIQILVPSRDISRRIPVTCFLPSGKDLPLVVFFHGGGLLFGSVEMYSPLAKHLASSTSSMVCCPAYRLAPENPYPAASHDAFDATVALLEEKEVGVLRGEYNPKRTAIFGISAGAHLAVVTSLRLAENKRQVSLVVAVQPMLIPFAGTPSMVRLADAPFVSQQMMNFVWYMYLQDRQSEKDEWGVNPLKADDSLFARVSPTVVAACEQDVLYSEGILYAQRLERAGRLIRLLEPPTSHVGILLYGEHAEKFWPAIATEMREGLGLVEYY